MITELEGEWGEADSNCASDAVMDVSTLLFYCILAEIAKTPAANMTDVAVKIGIVERELRIRNNERMLALLLSSAEQDCVWVAQHAIGYSAKYDICADIGLRFLAGFACQL